jgi:hypothetical protein
MVIVSKCLRYSSIIRMIGSALKILDL